MTPLIYAGLDSDSKLSFLNRQEEPIVNAVSEVTGITLQQIKSRSRLRAYVTARCLISHYLRKYTRMSLKEIGAIIGNRDHSTVIYNIATHNDLMQYDEEFRKLSKRVEERLSIYHNYPSNQS